MRRSTLSTITQKDTPLDVDDLANKMGVDINAPKTLADASHGEFITLEDGTTGLVVDLDEEFNQKYRDEKMDLMTRVASEGDQLFDCIAVDANPKVNAADVIKKKFGENSDEYMRLVELQTEFSKYTFGPKGLVPMGDPMAKDYAEKIEAVRSGKVRLPTVSEYEQQLKDLEKERKASMEGNYQNQQIQPLAPPVQEPPVPAPIPEQPAAPAKREIDPNTPVVGVQSLAPKAEPPAPNVQSPVQPEPPVTNQPAQVMQLPPRQTEPPVQQQKPAQIQPINIAKLQAAQNGSLPEQRVQEQKEVAPPDPSVVISLDAKEVPTFMETMPPELKEKVRTSATLEVRSVTLKDVPVATRTISSLTQFKNIMPRKVVGSLVQKVLVNSGYIVTVEGASSLEMATIAYDPETQYPDWPKRIQFAFDHIVSTSIGDLTFPQFIQETSASDIDVIIAAIYQASEPDIKKMVVICGNKRCRSTHEITFSVGNMFDTSEFDTETIAYFNEIVAAQDNIYEAREVHSRAPVMAVHYLRFDSMYFAIKHTDAEMAANYFPQATELAERYNAALMIYVAFIKEVRFEEDDQVYASSSPEVFCQALLNVTDDEGQVAIQNFIMDNVKEYKSYRYFMKPVKEGDTYVCKKCGKVDTKITVNPDTLVFRKANVAGRL